MDGIDGPGVETSTVGGVDGVTSTEGVDGEAESCGIVGGEGVGTSDREV